MATASAERDRTHTAAMAVFGVLLVATVGAFFVAQRLKRAKPVVRQISLPAYISPNGDGRKDRAPFSFLLPKADHVTVSFVNAGGDEIRRIVDDRHMTKGLHSFAWDGRDASASVPPDGFYYLRVTLRDQGRATTAPRGIKLVTKRPHPKLVSVTPSRIDGRGHVRVTVKFSGPTSTPPLFSVYRTGPGTGKPRRIAEFSGKRGAASAAWGGRDRRGRRVPPGSYAFAVTVENRALVAGSSPRRLPPTAAEAKDRTGLTIAGPQGAGPLEPVRAGSAARVALQGALGRVRYRIVRFGDSRPLKRGRATAPALRIRIPRKAATGLYVLRVRAAGERVAVPLIVRGRAPRRTARVLVVLPAIAWQGTNQVDDDADGFPDTLGASPSVEIRRPFALGRLPAALRRESAPLLKLLDQQQQRYDLTTDLALARVHGPRLAGHSGVLFAGSELWLSEQLDAELRSYVESGGRVASFGTDAFRRTVRVTAASLADPSPAQEANVFGEQTAPASSAAAPLVVNSDSLGLFSGSDGFIGLFTRFEQQQALVRGAKVQSAAGRDPKHPAFVAYRLGRGTVVRVGTPEWAGAVETDSEVAAVTRATWALLSR